MTETELINILPLFKGELKDAIVALAPYPELGRLEIGAIRKVLGYSGEPNQKLTEEQRTEMVELYKEGDTSLRKLSAKYGVNMSAVRSILKRRKVDTGPKDRWTPFQKHRLISMRKDHKSYREIAKYMGLSVSAIVQHAHRLGFPDEKSGLDPFVQTFDPFAKESTQQF